MTEEIRLKQEALTIAGEILDDVRPLRQEIQDLEARKTQIYRDLQLANERNACGQTFQPFFDGSAQSAGCALGNDPH